MLHSTSYIGIVSKMGFVTPAMKSGLKPKQNAARKGAGKGKRRGTMQRGSRKKGNIEMEHGTGKHTNNTQ